MVNMLEEYARLLIEVGLNVQKGQYVVINSRYLVRNLPGFASRLRTMLVQKM